MGTRAVVLVLLGLGPAAWAGVRWHDSLGAAAEEARAAGKPILVAIFDASPYSQRLRRLLASPEVEAWAAAHVVAVQETTTPDRNTPLLRRFRSRGLPLVVVADEMGMEMRSRAGAPDETPEQWIATVGPWVTAAAVRAGVRAYHEARDEEARRWLSRPAESGDPMALTFLGKLLADGRGGGADPARAEVLLRQAAAQDHDDALFQLGSLCLASKPAEAWKLILEAERRGHPKAALFLAERCWAEGESAKGDAYALRAVDAGRYPPAARLLAERALGAGREAEAIVWWGRAAPGDAPSLAVLEERARNGDARARLEYAHADLLGRELAGLDWKPAHSPEQLFEWIRDQAGARASVARAMLASDREALNAVAASGDGLARAWTAYRTPGAESAAALGALAREGEPAAPLFLEIRARRGDVPALRELARQYEEGPPSWRAAKRGAALRAQAEQAAAAGR